MAAFKGKSLADITLDPEEELPSISDYEQGHEDESEEEQQIAVQHDKAHKKNKSPRRNERNYNRWKETQKQFLLAQREVQTLLKTRKAPNKVLCFLLIKRGDGLLQDKTWKDIQNKIHNLNNKAKFHLRRHEQTALRV